MRFLFLSLILVRKALGGPHFPWHWDVSRLLLLGTELGSVGVHG